MSSTTQPRQRRILLRSLAGAFALGAIALVANSPGQAQVFGGHDSNAPVNVAADHGELLGKQNRASLSGNVVITQGDLTVRSARTILTFSSTDGNFKIHRLDATGGVVVSKGGQSASGQAAVYDFDRRIITLAGGVQLIRGSDRLNAARLVIDLNTGISTIDGGPGAALPGAGGRGRITGTFSVPKRGN